MNRDIGKHVLVNLNWTRRPGETITKGVVVSFLFACCMNAYTTVEENCLYDPGRRPY